MARVQMNVRIDPTLRDAIDARRSIVGQSRDEWVSRALRFALAHISQEDTTHA